MVLIFYWIKTNQIQNNWRLKIAKSEQLLHSISTATQQVKSHLTWSVELNDLTNQDSEILVFQQFFSTRVYCNSSTLYIQTLEHVFTHIRGQCFCTQIWNFSSPLEASIGAYVHAKDLVFKWNCYNQLTTIIGQIFECWSQIYEIGVRVQQVKLEDFMDLGAMCS